MKNIVHSHTCSSQEVKIKSAYGRQHTCSVSRNFMVKFGCPLFLTIEKYSENSVFGGGKKVFNIKQKSLFSAYKQNGVKSKFETEVPFNI